MEVIKFLQYDSDFFGLKVGKIVFPSKTENLSLDEIKELIQKSDYELIYLFVDIRYSHNIILDGLNYILVDSQLNLKMKIPLRIKPYKYNFITHDNLQEYARIEDLYKIAEEVVPFSRFSYDCNIEPKKII